MKKAFLIWILIGMITLIFSSVGTPQEKGKTPVKKQPKETVLDFNAAEVEAQFLTPAQGVIETVKKTVRSSLIKIRQDFVDEIKKSAEDL